MTPEDHNQIWDYVEAGESYSSIAKMMGSRLTTVRDFVREARRPATFAAEAPLGEAAVGWRA